MAILHIMPYSPKLPCWMLTTNVVSTSLQGMQSAYSQPHGQAKDFGGLFKQVFFEQKQISQKVTVYYVLRFMNKKIRKRPQVDI